MSEVTLKEVKDLIQKLRDEIPEIHASLHHDHCRVRMNDTGKQDDYLKSLAEYKLETALNGTS